MHVKLQLGKDLVVSQFMGLFYWVDVILVALILLLLISSSSASTERTIERKDLLCIRGNCEDQSFLLCFNGSTRAEVYLSNDSHSSDDCVSYSALGSLNGMPESYHWHADHDEWNTVHFPIPRLVLAFWILCCGDQTEGIGLKELTTFAVHKALLSCGLKEPGLNPPEQGSFRAELQIQMAFRH